MTQEVKIITKAKKEIAQKTKFVLITLKERNGEREYSHQLVREIPESADSWEWADKNVAADFMGNPDEKGEYDKDAGYYFKNGCFYVCVRGVREITKEDFKVLNRFL